MTLAAICLVMVLVGFAAGWALRTIKLGARYPSLIDDPGAIELTFVSRDAGRTWRFNGEALPASPLTDRLQDTITNRELGLAIGADRDERERAWNADRQGHARRFQVWP